MSVGGGLLLTTGSSSSSSQIRRLRCRGVKLASAFEAALSLSTSLGAISGLVTLRNLSMLDCPGICGSPVVFLGDDLDGDSMLLKLVCDELDAESLFDAGAYSMLCVVIGDERLCVMFAQCCAVLSDNLIQLQRSHPPSGCHLVASHCDRCGEIQIPTAVNPSCDCNGSSSVL